MPDNKQDARVASSVPCVDRQDLPRRGHRGVVAPATTLDHARLLAEIQRLYQHLRALPAREQPCDANYPRRSRHGSPRYRAIARLIRQHAERHWVITAGIRIGDRSPTGVD